MTAAATAANLCLLLTLHETEVEWMGSRHQLEPGEVVLFLRAYPHRLPPDDSCVRVEVPLAAALQWRRPPQGLRAVFGGALVRERVDGNGRRAEAIAFTRWRSEFAVDGRDEHKPSELEIDARVRRLLRANTLNAGSARASLPATSASCAAAAVAFIAGHLDEQLPVERIAAAVGTSPKMLLTWARRALGMPMAQFITYMRLARARTLLATTALPVLAVCHQAGFSSTVRLYDAFDRYLATTPARYRQALAQTGRVSASV